MMFDLSAGIADIRAFPRQRWIEATRTALAGATVAELAAPDDRGHVLLREALTGRLAHTRAAVAAPADIPITHGVTDAMARLCRALAGAGHRTLAVEDPGWPRLRAAAEAASLILVPIPVDRHGLRTELLAQHTAVRAVVTTPPTSSPPARSFRPRVATPC